MLFISRIRDHGSYAKYGVADTDDNSEEFVMTSDIEDAIYRGIDIKGVSFDGHLRVTPYQDPNSMTVTQAKMATLYGVSITTYRDEITSITWDSAQPLQAVRINLSDFGKRCADRLFSGANVWGNHRVTLVFDDSLKFSLPAFYIPGRRERVDSVGVYLDVRKMEDERNIGRIYHAVALTQPGSIESFIMDKPVRKRRMIREYYNKSKGK